jgi:hypothetical protein
MKNIFHTALRLLLVLAIFLGLQGKVIIRYAEIFHKNQKSEVAHSGEARVKARVIHCNLQCYTKHFQARNLPLIAFFFSFIDASIIVDLIYISFGENFSIVYPIRLLPLRAPPAL